MGHIIIFLFTYLTSSSINHGHFPRHDIYKRSANTEKSDENNLYIPASHSDELSQCSSNQLVDIIARPSKGWGMDVYIKKSIDQNSCSCSGEDFNMCCALNSYGYSETELSELPEENLDGSNFTVYYGDVYLSCSEELIRDSKTPKSFSMIPGTSTKLAGCPLSEGDNLMKITILPLDDNILFDFEILTNPLFYISQLVENDDNALIYVDETSDSTHFLQLIPKSEDLNQYFWFRYLDDKIDIGFQQSERLEPSDISQFPTGLLSISPFQDPHFINDYDIDDVSVTIIPRKLQSENGTANYSYEVNNRCIISDEKELICIQDHYQNKTKETGLQFEIDEMMAEYFGCGKYMLTIRHQCLGRHTYYSQRKDQNLFKFNAAEFQSSGFYLQFYVTIQEIKSHHVSFPFLLITNIEYDKEVLQIWKVF